MQRTFVAILVLIPSAPVRNQSEFGSSADFCPIRNLVNQLREKLSFLDVRETRHLAIEWRACCASAVDRRGEVALWNGTANRHRDAVACPIHTYVFGL